MTQLREPGEVWHIGWDWHANMWYVEPPFDVDLDEPIKWFNDRDEAFDFVDTWIREQPVQVSVLDQVDEPPAEFEIMTAPAEDEPVYVHVPEPAREVTEAPVHIPRLEEATNSREARLAEYAAKVGIKQ